MTSSSPAAAPSPPQIQTKTQAPVPSAQTPPPSTGGESAARTQLRRSLTDLQAELADAARALPLDGQSSLQQALATSAERVLLSYDLGRISPEEAERATKMLVEMTSALLALEHGRVTVTPSSDFGNSDLTGYQVQTTTGDVLRVAVRPLGNERGEARLKIENVVDDGAPVAQQDRLMIRFDLEGSGETSARSGARAMIDLQFGKERFNPADPREKLNQRIHGVLLDESGQPVLNRGGRSVPDHHFRAGVPSSLDDREGFARFVGGFLDELEEQRASSTEAP